ncbi:preprotein translocase subunit SCY2, chloroplastic [Cannabis sativa]|uniref:preprotein translocase subunit SCY2, chloroplastic n=1 Tax=Cannabis sativa TaxID=3483 RepID=UPI0029CA8F6A|nr:preprotein translocase subunit SCY2, chloroplastic [Cannabis sativa]
MEATLFSSTSFLPHPVLRKPAKMRGSDLQCWCPCFSLSYSAIRTNPIELSRRQFMFLDKPFISKLNKRFSSKCSNQFRRDCMNVDGTSAQSLNVEAISPMPNGEANVQSSHQISDYEKLQSRPNMFRNRFLNFVRFSSVLNNAAESFFKSEIRRRLFVTALLIIISRVGYFIPLPGFDRRLIPQDYLSFASGTADELGDFTGELKLSLFQLGVGPQIIASIIMQVLCHVVPSLVKLRKEGLDAQEKIKSYIWWMSLGFAIVEALIVSCYSLPYSIYVASHRVKHVVITSLFLVCGAMTITWICDTISESGFGQGSSLIICVGILTGYTEMLHNMLSRHSGSIMSWGPYVLGLLGVFTLVTMWAVVVTEGCRKVKLQYYGFKLASAARDDSPVTEVEPYIPFNINPAGMQPVLTTNYLLAVPSILASLLSSPFWEHAREILNPESSIGAKPWVYYSIYAFFVFLFNIFDIANLPKEISDYLNKMGARIPNVKPGNATIEYLTKIQASTRFWGGVLLSFLATSSTILDHYLRRINAGFAIGFTSILIIVGSIIELRRSYQAYNVMPSLSKALRRYGV